jgi:gliding motility-associated-like protein
MMYLMNGALVRLSTFKKFYFYRLKMRKLFLLILICTLTKQKLVAQKINNVWFFGYHTGLDFNSSPPAALDNPLIAAENPPYYTSSICDLNGSLLFFTNGFTVWNASRQVMPKFSSQWPWEFNDRILPLICPYPASTSLYYLFTVGKGTSSNNRRLLFSTIDMAGNNGQGALFYPQPSTPDNYYTGLADSVSILLTGTTHCNQRDSWIVTISNGALNSFLVSPVGVTNIPVTTALSVPQSSLEDGYSNMKLSANGEKLVMPVVNNHQVLVYDFNNQTGVFSNPVLIQLPGNEILEDVELSPTGSKLYYGSYVKEMDGNDFTGVESHNVYQLDLATGSATDIENNRYRLNYVPDKSSCARTCYIIHRTLQLGPDGKIYVSMRYGENLDKRISVIESPERGKENASYQGGQLVVGNVYKFINVSYIRSSSFSVRKNGIQVRKNICLGLPAEFSLFYSRIDSVKWNFGDSASLNNTSTSFTPSHNFTSVNNYIVTAVIYTTCHVDTARTQISIEPDPIVKLPPTIRDTIVCVGNKLQMNVATPNTTGYLWNDGFAGVIREINQPGTFRIKAYNACSEDQKSFTVKIEKCPCDIFIPSAFTPNNDGINDEFKPIAKCVAKNYRFKVFNRYGNLVFETSELNKGWNGEFNNRLSPGGVYVWILEYRNPNDNQLNIRRGSAALIR